MVYVTRRETFNAAHRLSVAGWTDEQNSATFGKCANKNWHGHNYQLFVTVVGKPHSVTGYVMDAKVLSDLIKNRITSDVDHSNMNLDVDWFPEGFQPSTENVLIAFWDRIEAEIESHGAKLYSMRLHETENIYAEYFGPNGK